MSVTANWRVNKRREQCVIYQLVRYQPVAEGTELEGITVEVLRVNRPN